MIDKFVDDGKTPNTFGVVTDLNKASAVPSPTGLNIPTNTFDQQALAGELRFAVDSLTKGNVKPEDVSPDMFEVIKTAFRQNNTIGSALSSRSLTAGFGEQTPMTGKELADRVEKDKLLDHARVFEGVRSVEIYEARKADLATELADRKVREAAGWGGFGADLLAGVLDPTLLIPGIGVGGRIASKASRGTIAAMEGALTGGVSTAAMEVGLQATQVDRSAAESWGNVAAGTLFGGALGFSVDRVFGSEIANRVTTRFDDVDSITPGSVGAARVDLDRSLAARKPEDNEHLFSGGSFAFMKAVGDIPYIGSYLRNPRTELERGGSNAERDFIEQMASSPSVTVGNTIDKVNPSNVESAIGKYRGAWADTASEVNDLFTKNKAGFKDRAEFNNAVSEAMARGDVSDNPVVQKAAETFRKRVFEPIEADLRATGVLGPDDGPLINAESYFPLVYNGDLIQAKEGRFREVHEEAFTNYFNDLASRALAAKENKAFDVQKLKVEQLGIKRKVPKIGDDGQPVINPKTGKPVMTTEVVKEGEVDQLTKMVKEDFKKAEADAKAELEVNLGKLDKSLEDSERYFQNKQEGRIRRARDVRDAAKAEAKNDPATSAVNIEKAKTQFEKDKALILKEKNPEADKLKAERTSKTAELKAAHKDEIAQLKSERDTNVESLETEAKAQIEKALGVKLGDEDVKLINQLVRGGEVDSDLIRKLTLDRVDSLYKSTTNYAARTFDRQVQGSVRGYRKVRSNPAYHAALLKDGFAVGDVMQLAERYVQTTATDIEFARRFRKDIPERDEAGKIVKDADGKTVMKSVPDLSLSEVKKAINAEYGEKLDGVVPTPEDRFKLTKKYGNDPKKLEEELGKAKARVENDIKSQRTRALENVDMTANFMRGIEPASSEGVERLKEASQFLGLYNYVTKMGGMVLTSLGDPINISVSQGFGRAVSYGLLPILKDFRAAGLSMTSNQRRLARLAMVNTEVEFNSRIAQLGGLNEKYLNNGSGGTLEVMRKLSETFSTYSGITYWNSLVKQMSYNTVQARILEHAERGFDRIAKSDQTWLRTLGIGPEDLGKISSEWNAQAVRTGAADMPVARWNEWADAGTGEKFRAAVHSEVANVIVAPTASDRIALSADPIGRAMLQFRGQMIANQMRLVGRNVQLSQIDGTKAAGVYTGLFGLVMMGALIDSMKQIVNNTGRENETPTVDKLLTDWTEKPEQQLYNALDRAGFMGPLMEGSNILHKVGGIGANDLALRLRQAAQGKDATQRAEEAKAQGKYRDLGWAAVVGGPSVGLIQDALTTAKVLGNAANSVVSDDVFAPKRSDFRAAERLVPFNNVPYIRGILNHGEAHVGTIYDWPSPK